MIEYSIDVSKRLIQTRWSGRITFDETGQLFRGLYADPDFNAGFNFCVFVEADTSSRDLFLKSDDLQKMLKEFCELIKGVKCAIVVSDQMSQLKGALLLDKDLPVHFSFFRDGASALGWIENADRSDPINQGRMLRTVDC